MESAFSIIDITKQRYSEAAAVLVEAFYTNSMFEYFFPSRKKEKMCALFTYLFHFYSGHFLKGVVNSDNRLVGAALFLKPGHKYNRINAFFLNCSLVFQIGLIPLLKIIEYTRKEDVFVKSDSYVLFYLGVKPEWQGRGLGGQLIGSCLQAVHGEPVMLATIEARTLNLYRKYNFAIVCEQTIKGQYTWFMERIVPG